MNHALSSHQTEHFSPDLFNHWIVVLVLTLAEGIEINNNEATRAQFFIQIWKGGGFGWGGESRLNEQTQVRLAPLKESNLESILDEIGSAH